MSEREQPEYNSTAGEPVDHDPDQHPETPDLNRGKGTIFSRVKDRMVEIAGSAKIRARMAGPERFAEAYNQFKFRDHEHRVNYLQDEQRIFASRIEDLQSKIEKIDQSADSVIANIGDLPSDIRQKFEAEKELLKKALEKNKELLADVEQQMSVQHEKTEQYDRKLKDIAKNLRESIDKALAGPEDRLQYLKGLSLQAGIEAANFRERLEEAETALDHMQLVWDSAASKTEQDVYKDQMAELKRLLKDYKKQLADREKVAAQAHGKSDALGKRLNYLRDKRDKYAAIEQNGVVPETVLKEKKEEAEKIREIETFLSRGRYSLDRVIEEWNKLYKSKLDLSGEDFKALFSQKERLDKLFYGERAQRAGVDYYTFIDLVSVYAKWKKIKLDFDTSKFIFEMQKLPRIKEVGGHDHGHGSGANKSHGHGEGNEKNLAERMRYSKYSLDALIAEWNKLHRAEMMILPNEFKNAITEQGSLEIKNKGIDIYYFADLVKRYAKKKKVKIKFDVNEFAKALKDLPVFSEPGDAGAPAASVDEDHAEAAPDEAEQSASAEAGHAPSLLTAGSPDAQSAGPDYESPIPEDSVMEFEEQPEIAAVGKESHEPKKNNRYERNIVTFAHIWNKYFSDEFKIDQSEFQKRSLEMFDPERFKTISISQMLEVIQKLFLEKEFDSNLDEIMNGQGHRKEFVNALKKLSSLFNGNKKGFERLEGDLRGKSFKESLQLTVAQEKLYKQKYTLAYLCDKWNEGFGFKLRIRELIRAGQALAGKDAGSSVEVGEFLDAAEENVSGKVRVNSSHVNLMYVFGKINFEAIINYDIRHNRAAARS
ncbi:hypothetical protein KGQ24_01145 [Patescibacteria group bacterium]|nr:hypothetical protein [Patescibacteria group bacterium]